MALIGALQATGGVGAERQNLEFLHRYAEQAAAEGVDVLVTPELFLSGYAPATVSREDGQRFREELATVAAKHGIALAASTVDHRGGHRHISASLFSSSGEELTRYRKAYLYGAEEQTHFEPGDGAIQVVSVADLQLALAICYDIEFPEVARQAAKQGADALLIPTAVPYTGDIPGEHEGHSYNANMISTLMVPCRSLENGLYIAYANHTRPDFTGLSCITSPYGNILAVGSGDSAELLVAEAFPSEVRRARKVNTYLEDLRR